MNKDEIYKEFLWEIRNFWQNPTEEELLNLLLLVIESVENQDGGRRYD